MVLIIYFTWLIFSSTNIVHDKNAPSGASGTVTSSNYSASGTTLVFDVTKTVHVIDPPTGSTTYNFYYLPPGKNDGDSITILLNTSSGTTYGQNIQIWTDNCKNNVSAYSASAWYPFARTITIGGTTYTLNTGSIAKAIWYQNYWYISTNSVNANT